MEDIADEITRLAALCGQWRSEAPRDGDPWSELPTDVLYQIMCHLPSIHGRLNLASVCRHWHAAMHQGLPYALPKLCLALPDGMFFTFQPRSTVLNLHPNSRHGSYRGATGSQLLYATDCCGVYSLVNPFARRERLLPVSSGIRVHEEEIVGNSPASEEGYWSEEMPVRKLVVCPDGLVAAIIGHECSARVALCRPEAAWSWVLTAHDPWRWYADMAFFDGKLYALTNDEDLLALEVTYDDQTGQPRISNVECIIEGGGRSRYALHEYTRMRYLVARPRGGGLLMVCRIIVEYSSTTNFLLVFQANLGSSQWVEVDTLGSDEALFVGRLYSRAVRATRHGVSGNHIFFLNDSARMEGPGLPLGDALANVYNMKDGRVSELLPMQTCVDGAAVPATWFFREDADAEE